MLRARGATFSATDLLMTLRLVELKSLNRLVKPESAVSATTRHEYGVAKPIQARVKGGAWKDLQYHVSSPAE